MNASNNGGSKFVEKISKIVKTSGLEELDFLTSNTRLILIKRGFTKVYISQSKYLLIVHRYKNLEALVRFVEIKSFCKIVNLVR